MAADYCWLNPHLTLTLTWEGQRVDYKASDPVWAKWRPYDPTSPHWYDEPRLRRLMGAYIARDEDHGRPPRTVREFISEFRGLSGSAKQKLVLEEVGASRLSLPEYFGNGTNGHIGKLLAAMCKQSRPVKPVDLGLIGKDHLAARFRASGVDLETFKYKRLIGETENGIPDVIEAAFGWCPDGENSRRIITGVNWSPAIENPFRSLGAYGESLDSILAEQRSGRDEPIIFVLHLARPRIEYTDHGKTTVALPGAYDGDDDDGSEANGDGDETEVNGSDDESVAERLRESVIEVTKAWARQRKAEERHAIARASRRERLLRNRRVTIKEAAWAVMEQAYRKASNGGRLVATATQIMYAARDEIQERTGKQLDRQYFIQTVLKDFLEKNPALTAAWDIAYDDRGHFAEPHTGLMIGLGTVAVRDYIEEAHHLKMQEAGFAPARIVTRGPDGCFGALLYLEKEGFLPLFEQVQLAARFDIGIMSSKGMSVIAARRLADEICHAYKIPLLVLRDFDKAGFSIIATFKQRKSRRYTFANRIDVIDLGLRLDDIASLQSEDVFDTGNQMARRANLQRNGATPNEVEFLLHSRVELNAMTSDQLVAFVERKLKQHGIKKIVPNKDLLDDAYCLAARNHAAKKIIARELKKLNGAAAVKPPSNLSTQVRQYLKTHPQARWDEAVNTIAKAASRSEF